MRDTTFFEQIGQTPTEAGGHRYCSPCFYYDVTTVTAVFIAPLRHLKTLLPSKQMKLLRLSPVHGLIAVTVFEYRDSDIGPYNEVSISLPVTVDKRAPMLVGALGALGEPMAYVWQLPVTTEIARFGGVEFYGFPKFIAEIAFTRENGWIRCHLAADGQDILALGARQVDTKRAKRSRMHPLTMKGERILRCEVIVNPRQMGVSRRAEDVTLELGDHLIAQQLRGLELGRMIQMQYMPENQSILAYALESYAA
jgi:hypothetical protein